MNNTVLSGIIVGAVVLAAAGGIVANSGYNPLQKYATVVSVEPAYNTSHTPREVCGDHAALAQPASAGAGTAAVAPAPSPEPPAPSPAAKNAKAGEEGVEDCVTVYDTRSVQAGFDVTYELDGRQDMIRMDHDPGKRIPVEDGELVLSRS
jgi:uncharacterized protein YcfJ